MTRRGKKGDATVSASDTERSVQKRILGKQRIALYRRRHAGISAGKPERCVKAKTNVRAELASHEGR